MPQTYDDTAQVIGPRDFKAIPRPDRGEGEMLAVNQAAEEARVDFLEAQLRYQLRESYAKRGKHMMTTALIAGDCVILDLIAKEGLLDQTVVVFCDTLHLFAESLTFLKEIESKYGFKALHYYPKGYKAPGGTAGFASPAEGAAMQERFWADHGEDFYLKTKIDSPATGGYDMFCKTEPLLQAFAEHRPDVWINGRRRDHGAERAMIPLLEHGKKGSFLSPSKEFIKFNALAMWSFEDCWSYLRKYFTPYHPLHDARFPSIGDSTSTVPVVDETSGLPTAELWFAYDGERKGRFVGLVNADGTKKTECGIHVGTTEAKTEKTGGA